MDVQDFSVLEARLMVDTNEFHSKMTYDFTRIIFLGLRNETTTKGLGEVVRLASTRHGYLGYKTFSYKDEKTTHLYVKYENCACAEKAIVFFRSMDRMFNADVVNNVLLTWYMIEKSLDEGAELTTTCVDIEPHTGSQTSNRNNELQSVMGLFGPNRVVSTSLNSAQVFFPSFALALAATIALGRWCLQEGVDEEFSKLYTVKIVGADKEARLFTICGSPPDEAFRMDYFVQPAADSGDEPSLSEFTEKPEFENKLPKKISTGDYSERKCNKKQHMTYKNVCESKAEFLCINQCRSATSKHLDIVTNL